MYVHEYRHNTKKSLALNLEIGKTNWHLIADIRNSALSLVVSQIADQTQFCSAIFVFCSENGRWQAAISSSGTICILPYCVTMIIVNELCNCSMCLFLCYYDVLYLNV